ncbi:PEGA domain-containing protein [Deinococcus planocerae]|uniref:PEGA domain-containing protein n=1 Tax=Deinococcus planocerae TaxID=1737569 RepID=UPI000C7ED957|nr:PEGA domain-containing protein [Deinococcus planocerae]
MTQGNTAPLLPFDEPRRTLQDVHDDLKREMARLHGQHPDLYEEAVGLFKKNQNAKEHVPAAEQLLADVQALSHPVNLPFVPAASAEQGAVDEALDYPQTTPEPVTTDDTLGLEDGEESEEGEIELDETAEDVDPAADDAGPDGLDPACTVPEATPPVTWPEGTLGAGMISQLAGTLGAGETLSLILARVGDTLLVTVQPTPIQDEPNSTVVPLQVKGLPSALDTQLVMKLNEYREGRSVARDTAHYVATVRAAAEAHRKATQNAAKPKAAPSKPATPASQEGHLTVEVSPRDATLVLTDGGSKTHPFQAGKKTPLPAGEYTLSLDAPGYEAQTQKLSVKPGKETKTAFVLKKASAPSLF